MPYTLWVQDNFTKGELSPFMYARGNVQPYQIGLKTAQNVLMYPTGSAGKRFGTLYQNTLSTNITPDGLYFAVWPYLDQCIYQLVFYPGFIDIYLEGIFQLNVATTFSATDVFNLSTTIYNGNFLIAGAGFQPFGLTRTSGSNVTIASSSGNQFNFAGSYTIGSVYPVTFTNSGGALPNTTPQINSYNVYFAYLNTGSSAIIYTSAYNAKFNIDPIIINDYGSGTNKIFFQNDFILANLSFTNLPFFDFNGGYTAITFTPSTKDPGNGATLTASSSIFTAAHVGGAFFGNGGSARITAVASGTSATISIQDAFINTNPILGSLALLAQPAWSDTVGWPEKVSSYQNRLVYANTQSLPNGIWLSVINDIRNFGNLTNDDDDAIAWFPASNNVNDIRFIVPYRSLTVHTNSGVYSSPLSEIYAVTPTTFTLQLQDSTPADVLQPQAIDNQVIILSGNDAHTMLWDGINNAYTSNIISVINEQLIRNPVDQTSYADLTRAGSRYLFVINADGSMAIYQTLQSENVAGWVPAIMEQSYGDASFIQSASSPDGRCWFVVARKQASNASPIPLSGNTSIHTLVAVGSNFNTTTPTAVTFTALTSLPVSSPQLQLNTYYWAIGVDANTFMVYLSQDDALNNNNSVTFVNYGSSAYVVPWILAQRYMLEELNNDVLIDCATYYNGTPSSTINTGLLYNAQDVVMIGNPNQNASISSSGNAFGFTATGQNNTVSFTAHGQAQNVGTAYIGFPITTIIEPMPLALLPGSQNTLTKPLHVRFIRLMFNNTIGGEVNGIPISIQPFDQLPIGSPPTPATGFMELGTLSGWDNFDVPTFTIEHSDPFQLQLLGIFYSVDI